MPITGAVAVLFILAVGTTIAVAAALLSLYTYSRRRDAIDWELGTSYLVKEKGSNRGFALFHKLVGETERGMVITRTFPEKIRSTEHLTNSSIWWLSREESEQSINPTSLAKLTHVVKEFIEERKEAIVLLDGLEYLILQNGFETALRFIQALNDLVILNKATLIVPVDPASLSVKELSLLEKEMETHRLSMNILRFFGESVT